MATYKLQPVIAGPSIEALDSASQTGNTIRYVGPQAPVVTNWAINDVWIDTITAATPVLRVWTGTVFAPARSASVALMVDQFTGTNGAVWSTGNWATGVNPSVGTGFGAVINGNQGQMTTSNTGSFTFGSRISRKANITSPSDANISASVTFDSTSPDKASLWVRGNSTLDGTQGYALFVGKGIYFVSKVVSSVGTDFNTGGTAFGYADGIQYSARLRVVGTTVQAKIWVATDAEPLAWGVSVTDSAITGTGTVGLLLANGGPAAVSNVYWDNVTVDPV